jgi:hypothetical protein
MPPGLLLAPKVLGALKVANRMNAAGRSNRFLPPLPPYLCLHIHMGGQHRNVWVAMVPAHHTCEDARLAGQGLC